MKPPDEDFAQIKVDLITEIREMRKDFNRMLLMVDTHEQALYGDKKTTPGMMEDVRILKKSEEARKTHFFAIYAAIIVGVVERSFHYLTGR